MNKSDDSNLIENYLNGDEKSFNILYEKYRLLVYSYTNKFDETEDIAQDIWLKVINKISSMDNDTFIAWLIMIIKNTIIDHLRRKETRKKREIHPEHDEYDDTIDQIPYHVLKGYQKKVVEMKLAGMKHKEISSELNIPLSSSLTYYRQSVKLLRKKMKQI